MIPNRVPGDNDGDRRWELSLFDIEDAPGDVPVAELAVGPVSTRDVREFAIRYHYTHTHGSVLYRRGLWHDVTLYGVVTYNLPTRSVCDSVFGPEHYAHVWHMGRLMLADHAPLNSESRLIGGSLRAIQRDHPEIWAVVTYAATDVGHIGYVYQATNALYTGLGGDAYYWVDQRGQRHSTYLSGHVNAERGAALGWTRHPATPKHRYLYLLGSRTHRKHLRRMLRWPVLDDYPKGEP